VENFPSTIKKLYISNTYISELDLSNCEELKELYISCNVNITSIDFLSSLPHLEKLKRLEINNNNIHSTNLDFLRPFVNLERLDIGISNIPGIEKK
jgi:Leucine-rich repeat (LRR) protein